MFCDLKGPHSVLVHVSFGQFLKFNFANIIQIGANIVVFIATKSIPVLIFDSEAIFYFIYEDHTLFEVNASIENFKFHLTRWV